jgi:signal peptidase complex subunit 1
LFLKLTSSQAIAFAVGYLLQDIKLALFIELGGTAVVFLAIVPPWPFFNQSPVRWLSPGGGALPPPKIEVDGQFLG